MPRYRFRVRSADGQEVLSPVFGDSSDDLDLALGTPEWSNSDFGHGEKAGLRVTGEGIDGHQVKFVIEHKNGENWEAYQEVVGTMTNGVATAELELSHPAVKAGVEPEEISPAGLRFHCQVLP